MTTVPIKVKRPPFCGAVHAGPYTWSRLAPAVPTGVFDSYWRLAAERQSIYFKRLGGETWPWTDDPILRSFKFTNAYRASDRTSQFLIRNVMYREDLPSTPVEVFFRLILFKLFNKIETWQWLERKIGQITWASYSYKAYDDALLHALASGRTIYSGAYIMPSGCSSFGEKLKHRNHLKLIEKMLSEGIVEQIRSAKSMRSAFEILLDQPTIGYFLAYQFLIDVNYSELTDFSENDFVVPGPGAKSGIRKCFSSLGGLTEPELIRFVCDRQESEFERLGLEFKPLWGRALMLIDCQNLFCEVDKYARVFHPEVIGTTSRNRIKQKYFAGKDMECPWFPPKWNLNNLIQSGPNNGIQRISINSGLYSQRTRNH